MPIDPRDADRRRGRRTPSGRSRRPRTALAGLATAAMLMTAGACSGDDQDAAPTAPTPTPTDGSSAAPPAQAPLQARVGVVAGGLPKAERRAAAAAVGEVVDGWLDAAYVGGTWPRTDFDDAFPGFTRGAAAKATAQAGLLTNQAVGGRVESVSVDRKVAKVDLVADKRKPVGATARVRLLFTTTGEYAHQVRVIGRLFLTPGGPNGSWKVFGYDVRKAEL